MATVGSTPYASASLYVGDLVNDVTEALLFEIFNAVGPVASVRVCRDAATRRSLGYAYVNFHRVDDAERALDTMNFKPIRNRACRIMWSHRDPSLRKSGVGNIFVKNLAKSIDNKALYDTFSVFGNILSCKVAVNIKRESLGYGFVHYETEESGKTAIAKANGKVIAGQQVIVTAFKSKRERGGQSKNRFTNVYVKNLPEECTKEILDELFGTVGVITSSVLHEAEMKAGGSKRKFGFVNFTEPEMATAAVDKLNGHEMNSVKLYVARAQKKEEREKELREKFEQLKMERQKKWAGLNLYVKNLGDEFDDERLRQEFSLFGSITSAKIMIDEKGKSRGFGFVCMGTPEEATKAVTDMNGKMIDAKPVYVALAQRKEARRAQLETQFAARAKMGVPAPQMGYPGGAPMFYQGVPQRAILYSQQPMMPSRPRWTPGQPAPGQMMGMARGPMNGYQLMPVPNGGRSAVPATGGPAGARNARGGARRTGGGKPQVASPQTGSATPQSPVQQGQIQYKDNVRNRDRAAQAPVAPASDATPVAGGEPLIKQLAAVPEEQKKQIIGNHLFPLVAQQQPALAGKITGMLLEMDNHELIHLLESQGALHEKIMEAMAVLQTTDDAVEGTA